MGNILDKTDQSAAYKPARIKDAWADLASRGRNMDLSKYQLNIDDSYQRGGDQKASLQIARNWIWSAFGVILVAQRSDGTYWVIDGGRRVRAAFMRDDVDLLPCLVFQMSDLADEAWAFRLCNKGRSSPQAIYIYRATLIVGNKQLQQVEDTIQACGYSMVERSGLSGAVINAAGVTMRYAKIDSALLCGVFRVCAQVADGQPITEAFLTGLFALARAAKRKGLDLLEPQWTSRLIKAGLDRVNAEITRAQIKAGERGYRTRARALLYVINYGSRNRLAISLDDEPKE